jgi:hypothetical protein
MGNVHYCAHWVVKGYGIGFLAIRKQKNFLIYDSLKQDIAILE